MGHLLSQNGTVWTCNIIILHDPFKSMGAKVSGAFYYGRMGVSQCKVIYPKYFINNWKKLLSKAVWKDGFWQTKGQLISKENYLDLDSSKKWTKYLTNSALVTGAEVLGSFFWKNWEQVNLLLRLPDL